MIDVEKNVIYTQARGCRVCIHIGSIAVYFGSNPDERKLSHRLEICTQRHWWRYSKLKREKP